MLPPNFLTIPQIQNERQVGSKLMYLTTLLEYLLKLYNPNVTAAEEGRDPKVGERVIACQHIFDNVAKVLWALKIRNSFAHVIETASFTERDHRNAVDYLIEAIGDVCRQPAIPRQLVQEIYHDPDADLRGGQEAEEQRRREQQAQVERERRARAERAQKLRAEELRLEETRLRQAQRERESQERRSREAKMWQTIRSGFRWLVLLALLAGGGYYFWPKLVILYKGDKAGAAVVRTEAGLALKKVREKRKQKEYGAVIAQAEAAWRDGEIEFKRGNYRLAEEKYRLMIGIWDTLNARVAESLSYDELLAEVNSLRAAAGKAQAQQKATDLWNQAEETRRNAETARKNGDLQSAKNLIIQARQQYETAQATALTQTSEPDTAGDDDSSGGSPETTPTALPEPVLTPTAIAQPTVEKTSAPPPVDNNRDDDTFTISEREFMRYVTRRVTPVISQQARNAGVSGPVVIEVYLSKHGHLARASVIEGDMLLRESALAALRQWSFKPYLLDRVSTEVRSEITIWVR
jgi:TonB family protein